MRRGLAAVVAALALVTAHAEAAPRKRGGPRTTTKPADHASTDFESGEAHFNAGEPAAALEDFKKAEAVRSTPEVVRYIALCEDATGAHQDAVRDYERFIAMAPARMRAEVDSAKKRVEEIRQLPAKVHATSSPPGATVTIDGSKEAGKTPVDVELTPGRHTLRFTLGDRRDETEIEVPFASEKTVNVALREPEESPSDQPSAAAATTPTRERPEGPPPPGDSGAGAPRDKTTTYVTGGLALVSAGVGTAFGVLALGKSGKFRDEPTTSTAESGEAYALVADVGFGLALTLGIACVMTLVGSDDDGPPTSPSGASSPRRVARGRRGPPGAAFRF